MGFRLFNLYTILLFLSILISFLCQTGTEANPTYLAHDCGDTTLYTFNSTYRANLDRLLAYLSNATNNLEFYNATVGHSVDTAYGLYICRGDLPTEACRDCVAKATKYTVAVCPQIKDAVTWFEECMLRYSDRYIFSTMAPDPNRYNWSTQSVPEASRFDELVIATMNDLATELSSGRPRAKKFGTKEASFTASQKLYTSAQCTPDLSNSNINRCLQQAIANIPSDSAGKQGARVLFTSCYIRFDLNPFCRLVEAIPPPPGSVTTPKGQDQISSRTIVAIAVPIFVSVLLFFMDATSLEGD